MKILLTLFVLLFSASVVAEDISDFEIEGIGLGVSLLDFFSEKEIVGAFCCPKHLPQVAVYNDFLRLCAFSVCSDFVFLIKLRLLSVCYLYK